MDEFLAFATHIVAGFQNYQKICVAFMDLSTAYDIV